MIESAWPAVRLQEVTSFQEGPGILAKDFCKEGTPLIRLAGLGEYEVRLSGCNYIDPAKANSKWNHFKLNRGDILVSTSASFGRPAVVGAEAAGALFYTGIIRFNSSSPKLHHGYLKTFLGSTVFMQQAEALASGSVIRHFGPSHLREMFIPLPPIRTQEAISSIHAALDDKIDLNGRMNDTLQGIARAIFKDWFVDFGPTRAKAEGLAPYLAPEIWALFPGRLDDQDKPEGWNVEAVYDQAIWVNGAAYKDVHFSSEQDALPVVKIAELKSGITKTTRFTNSDLGERYRIRSGELLFSWSGNPDTSIDTFVWTLGDAWLNQHIFAVRPNGKRSQAFLYAMLKFLRSEFAEIARNKQTTGLGHVTQQDLIRLTITAPSEVVQIAFDKIVGPLHSQFTSNLFQNQVLITTRDFLLPKLMSGEILIREAEKSVEAVA